ncbi:MAG: ligand-binding SRPBCC domain-containing protein [Planctomycetota bacterium]|jgi:ligand-binding SRPBCC domain-containing protein
MKLAAIFSLEREQTVRRSLKEVFGFFSDPRNLEALTPSWLSFRVLESSSAEIEEGTTIDYSLRLHGISIRWKSRISSWNPPFEFVDEQVIGPYRSWVHRHSFSETDHGVLVRDRVDYSVLGGAFINRLFVRRDLERIFDQRMKSLKTALPDE